MTDNGSLAAATWEQVELARHPDRPYALDYIHALFSNFFELHGDRGRADAAFDRAKAIPAARQRNDLGIITRAYRDGAFQLFGAAEPIGGILDAGRGG